MENFIGLVPDFNEDSIGMFTCKQDFKKEFTFLKNILEDCDSPLVFCHLDLNLPNIVYDGTDVHFIDVEYAGCSHPAYDIILLNLASLKTLKLSVLMKRNWIT